MKPKLSIFLITVFIGLLCGCSKNTSISSNKPPVANAGISETITLPTDSLKLTGMGSDADGSVAAYIWSQLEGPSSTIIVNPASPSTIVHGFKEGTYVFQLLVTDNNGATGVDTMSVIVNPSPFVTLTLDPTNNPDEYTLLLWGTTGYTNKGTSEIPVEAWTNGGIAYTIRGLFKFDLSSIPANATITDADLFLYSDPSPGNGNLVDANYNGSDNSLLLQQVKSSWNSSVTWFNQPDVINTNQVEIPATSNSILDLDIKVKDIVSSMISTGTNYGFKLSLKTENTYNSRIFCSSYHPDSSKHPKLVIVYKKN